MCWMCLNDYSKFFLAGYSFFLMWKKGQFSIDHETLKKTLTLKISSQFNDAQ